MSLRDGREAIAHVPGTAQQPNTLNPSVDSAVKLPALPDQDATGTRKGH